MNQTTVDKGRASFTASFKASSVFSRNFPAKPLWATSMEDSGIKSVFDN